MDRLTEKSYWDDTYSGEREPTIAIGDWRSYCNAEIFAGIAPLIADGSNVLEVGAGDSPWLPFLARQFPHSRFSGLDYSQAGCERLAGRCRAHGVQVDVHLADLFSPPDRLLGSFDLVLSFGVVEHFSRLDTVLSAKAALASATGTVYTLIPNMAGICGRLTRRWNRAVYELHVPHDLASFRRGHADAALALVASGYLGSSNFGVLSSCFPRPAGAAYQIYKQLTRVSKLVWLLESRGLPVPRTRALSPYIFGISRRADGGTRPALPVPAGAIPPQRTGSPAD